ncbi:MAG: hypothetical protein U5K75_12195 [Ahrensia sp.]|nr:hypothetical protein [Ahrensia sp.]
MDQDQVEQALEWLADLPQLPHDLIPDQHEIQAIVDALSKPAPPSWIMARAAATLSPYYAKDIPHGIRQIEAEDWLAALSGYPQWAIERASRWWKGEDNPDRRKAPLEGDIAARCNIEMRGIRSVPALVGKSRSDQGQISAQPEARITAKRAAEIMKEAGFNSMNGYR